MQLETNREHHVINSANKTNLSHAEVNQLLALICWYSIWIDPRILFYMYIQIEQGRKLAREQELCVADLFLAIAHGPGGPPSSDLSFVVAISELREYFISCSFQGQAMRS